MEPRNKLPKIRPELDLELLPGIEAFRVKFRYRSTTNAVNALLYLVLKDLADDEAHTEAGQ